MPLPCPEAVSAADPGTMSVNYRNEPVALRAQDPATNTQAAGDAGDLSNIYRSDVTRANPEFTARIAHRGAAVAAAPRLVEQQRAVLRLELAKHGRRRLGDQHPCDRVLVIQLSGAQKKPSFLGL